MERNIEKQGIAKYHSQKYREALQDFNIAIQLQAGHPDADTLSYRGATKRMLGDLTGALEDLNRADEMLPNNAFTLRQRGATKRMLGDYQGAREDLTRADEIRPNDAFTLQQLAIIRYYLSDFRRALEDINFALQQFPDEELFAWKLKIEEQLNRQDRGLPVVPEGVLRVPFGELKVIKKLGEGGFGEVSLAEWRGMDVAIKKLKSNVIVDDESHEAKTLMLLRYKFIVLLMGVSTDPTTNSTVLIMEYMRHGSLEDLLFNQNVKLSRASVIRLALDIALGVNYLHSQTPKVLHRDLKSANVLLHRNKTRAKIADFGTAKFLLPNVSPASVIGNALIAIPPEMVAEEPYDEKINIFSFGVVLYEMLTNKRLSSLDEIYRMKRIRENITDAELMPLRQLVLDCCVTDPAKRPCMRDIIELLRKMKNETN